MARLVDLQAYLDELLKVSQFRDYCPNGLQVEGRAEVLRLVSGVTASLALIEQAQAWGADAFLVHHGYFWKNENPAVIGAKRQRLARLLAADMSLLAYHLPLDAHPEYGNNAQLARHLDLLVDGQLAAEPLLWFGHLATPTTSHDFAQLLTTRLARAPLVISGSERLIQRVAWCSGAAQGFLEQAAQAGMDAYLSGEVSEASTHLAREYGIHYFAIGHHASERYGVQALGAQLAAQFGLSHQFIEIPNPV